MLDNDGITRTEWVRVWGVPGNKLPLWWFGRPLADALRFAQQHPMGTLVPVVLNPAS